MTSLIPDGEKSRLPLVVEEIRMREVEPANVDDPDQDAFATTVRGRAPDRPRQRGLRRLRRRRIELQGVDRMHERNRRVAFERIEHRDWDGRRHEVAAQQPGANPIVAGFGHRGLQLAIEPFARRCVRCRRRHRIAPGTAR